MSDHIIAETLSVSKCCSKCGQYKPISDFYKDARCKDGIITYCKECCSVDRKSYYIVNKDKILIQAKTYRDANKKKICERDKIYQVANKEKISSYKHEYYIKNKEKYTEINRLRVLNGENAKQCKARYNKIKDNPEFREKKREQSRAWAKANPESNRSHYHRYKARKLSATGIHTAQQIKDLLVKQKGKCAYCKTSIRKKYHADHIISLARGGTNDIYNIQLLCPLCNFKKNAKDPIEYAQQLGLLL